MSEKTIEARLRDRVKRIGGKAYKFVSPGNPGVTDRMVVMPWGQIYLVELKNGNRPLDPYQEQFRKDMLAINVITYKLGSNQEVDDWIDQMYSEYIEKGL